MEDQSLQRKEVMHVDYNVLVDKNSWNHVSYCLKSSVPLAKILLFIDRDMKPGTSYVCEAMDRANQ